MHEPYSSQRFPALYRAVEKMKYAGQPPVMRLAVEFTEPAAEPPRALPQPPVPAPEGRPDRKSRRRPVVTTAPIAWVAPAPPGSSPDIHSLRNARARAERELVNERERIIQAVEQARKIRQQADSGFIPR